MSQGCLKKTIPIKNGLGMVHYGSKMVEKVIKTVDMSV